MTCRQLAAFLLDYSEGQLPAGTQARFERHLQRCPNCRAYLAQYLAAVRFGRRAFADDNEAAPDAGVPNDLVAAILDARKESSSCVN
jgi:anti-sigma factor RsiW